MASLSRDEKPDFSKPYAFVDPEKPYKHLSFENYHAVELMHCYIKDGEVIRPVPTTKEVRETVNRGLSEMWEEEKRFYNPHKHYMDMSPKMYELKQEMLHAVKR